MIRDDACVACAERTSREQADDELLLPARCRAAPDSTLGPQPKAEVQQTRRVVVRPRAAEDDCDQRPSAARRRDDEAVPRPRRPPRLDAVRAAVAAEQP